MIFRIKNIKLTIFAPDPEKRLSKGLEYKISLNDDGTIIDALSMLDKQVYKNPESSIFPIYKGLIHSYLQLIWDAEENMIYEDCAVNAYGPNREFIPLQEDINFNLFPDSEITIVVHADWWADVMKERLDFGTFKRIIMKEHGKNHEAFGHYFEMKRMNK